MPPRPIAPSRALAFLARAAPGCGLRLARNLAKRALGRPPFWTAHDRLCRLVLVRWLGRWLGSGPGPQRLTSIASTLEGAGSQALMTMRAIAFARAAGLAYVHTPFAAIHHLDRPTAKGAAASQTAWAAAWEALFNLGDGEVPSDGGPGIVNYALGLEALHGLYDVPVGAAFDAGLLDLFRRRYRANKPAAGRSGDAAAGRDRRPLRVAVHARRRNAHDFHDDDAADLPRLGRILAQLRQVLGAIDHELRLFSQGPPADFATLGLPAAALHLDTDPVQALGALIDADVLVVGGGSFGQVAGLLCEGIVLGDGPDADAQGWIACDAAGRFDAARLRRRLARRVA